MFIAYIKKVIAVHSCADYCRRSHHRHSAAIHSHLKVGTGRVLAKESQSDGTDEVGRDDVAGKGVAYDLRVGRADRFGLVEVRVRMGAEGVVNRRAAHAEI